MYNGKRQPTACTQNAHSFRKTAPSRTQALLRETWLWGRAGGGPQDPAGCRVPPRGTRRRGKMEQSLPGLQLPESTGESRPAAGPQAIPCH